MLVGIIVTSKSQIIKKKGTRRRFNHKTVKDKYQGHQTVLSKPIYKLDSSFKPLDIHHFHFPAVVKIN